VRSATPARRLAAQLLDVLPVGLMALWGWRLPDRAASGLIFVAVAIVLVTGTAAPPGASLWLVPLAALAGVRWRDHLVWAACEGAYFVAHWLFVNGLVEHTKGLPAGWYAVFLLVRLAGIAWLARAAVPSISGRHAPTGTLDRLPSACGKPPPVVGDAAYPPVTGTARDRYRPKEAG
jgi:hypothetical protein